MAKKNESKLITVQEFFRRFPDDDTCLDHLVMVRYGETADCPKCGKHGKFHRLRKEPAYSCQWCGHHIHPMKDTPFERTRTPLQKWFYAIYLFTTSRHGVPAKELQRQLGVTYKTAWRMGHEIRKYMGAVDGDDPLDGHVEVNETMLGGRRKGGKRGRGAPGKTTVMGMLQRGDSVMTRVVENVRRVTLEHHILENIRHGAQISTDELASYSKLSRFGYKHRSVNHSADQWVDGETHTNAIKGFWSQIKRSVRGTHIHVSRKHLPKYLGEFEFRYNMRGNPALMFPRLLLSF
ncbi:MAG: IS1595 family transposase [Kiloniellaceae bacterium]